MQDVECQFPYDVYIGNHYTFRYFSVSYYITNPIFISSQNRLKIITYSQQRKD